MSRKALTPLALAGAAILSMACDPVTSVEVLNDTDEPVEVVYRTSQGDRETIEPGTRGRMGGWSPGRRASVYEVTDTNSGTLLGCLVVQISDDAVGDRINLRVSETQPCPP